MRKSDKITERKSIFFDKMLEKSEHAKRGENNYGDGFV